MRRAKSRRRAIMSVATIVAPVRLASMVNISPIGPWPRIATSSPGLSSICFTALRQVLMGSTKQARSKGTPSGIRTTPRRTIQSITRTYSENPPPAGSISRRHADSLVGRALRVQLAAAIEALRARDVVKDHDRVARREPADALARRRPRLPAISCPKMRGGGSRSCSTFLRSVWQMPQLSTRTSISPGPMRRRRHRFHGYLPRASVNGGPHGAGRGNTRIDNRQENLLIALAAKWLR